MPYLEYECVSGHRSERFYRTISEGERHPDILCETCQLQANRVPSVPLGFALYGDPAGYSKPSATKRFSTKTVSRKEGNQNSAG